MALTNPLWKQARSYDVLIKAEKSAFAWEWLRRTARYRRAYGSNVRSQTFGLETYENPDVPVPFARPIWTAARDTSVVHARVHDLFADACDRVDLLRLQHLTSIAFDASVEHLLFSDGIRSVRLDLEGGSLVGSPASLCYEVYGLLTARAASAAVRRFVDLAIKADLPVELTPRGNRQRILELRAADAIADGASHAEIAFGLFNWRSSGSWRDEDDATRTRVQRLVRRARSRLRDPLAGWFDR